MREEFYKTLSSPVWWGVLALAALLPLVLSSYYLHIVILSLVYVALASSWNIVGGMAGQISLAHSLFIGIGAMLSSALLLKLGINMWLGLLISAAISAALGAIIAWIDFRFRLGHLSFVLITLAFAEMGGIIVEGWDFLGGASGLMLPRDTGNYLAFQFGGGRGAYWVMLALAAICVLINVAILNAPLGYYLRTIRDNEKAAQAIGVNILRYKISRHGHFGGAGLGRRHCLRPLYDLCRSLSPDFTCYHDRDRIVCHRWRARPGLWAGSRRAVASASWRDPSWKARQHVARPALLYLWCCSDRSHSADPARAAFVF